MAQEASLRNALLRPSDAVSGRIEHHFLLGLVSTKDDGMRTTQQLSITLPTEMARLVKEKVQSGSYASESEVIREGLRALAERDAAIEQWLRQEVVPAYDAHKAAPDRARPFSEVRARLEDQMARLAGRKSFEAE